MLNHELQARLLGTCQGYCLLLRLAPISSTDSLDAASTASAAFRMLRSEEPREVGDRRAPEDKLEWSIGCRENIKTYPDHSFPINASNTRVSMSPNSSPRDQHARVSSRRVPFFDDSLDIMFTRAWIIVLALASQMMQIADNRCPVNATRIIRHRASVVDRSCEGSRKIVGRHTKVVDEDHTRTLFSPSREEMQKYQF